MRRFVIGDVHGCSKALRTLVEEIRPAADDQLIFLGDFIDRGPDSRGVIDLVLDLTRRCRVIPLRGNHEVMLLGVLFGGCDATIWLQGGGQATVASYGGSLQRIPGEHLDFYRSLRRDFETEREIFVHAGYDPETPIDKLDDSVRYWNHLEGVPRPHFSGKRVFVGHTPQAGGNLLDYGHLVCMDTYCFGGGYLSALELDCGDLLQVDSHGHLRKNLAITLGPRLRRLWQWLLARRHAMGATDAGVVEQRKSLDDWVAVDQPIATSPKASHGWLNRSPMDSR